MHPSYPAPSISRRIFRAVARFFIAALIGVGVTLAWQSHGDQAKSMVGKWAPSLGWWLPVSTTKLPPDVPQSAPVTERVAPARAASSPELMQQLVEPMAHDLAVIRRGLEQLAAKQEQMAQDIATLQAVEQQRMASPPSSQSVPIPPRKRPQEATQSSARQSSSVPSQLPPSAPPLRSR